MISRVICAKVMDEMPEGYRWAAYLMERVWDGKKKVEFERPLPMTFWGPTEDVVLANAEAFWKAERDKESAKVARREAQAERMRAAPKPKEAYDVSA